eukprot:388268-Prymnesium_polylepis.6
MARRRHASRDDLMTGLSVHFECGIFGENYVEPTTQTRQDIATNAMGAAGVCAHAQVCAHVCVNRLRGRRTRTWHACETRERRER